LILTVVMLVLRTVVRGNLPAVALVTLLGAVFASSSGAVVMLMYAGMALFAAICLIRFGLVALVAFNLVFSTSYILRAALAWNGGAGVLMLAALVALTLGAAHIAMGSPRMLRAFSVAAS
jgi:hypothetical protein